MKLFRRLMTWTLVAQALGSGFVAYADASDTSLVGFMRRDDSWLDSIDPEAFFGFYQFRADGEGGFRAVSPVGPDNQWAFNGATYANGKYYCYSIGEDDVWNRYTLRFRVLDGVTWKTVTERGYSFPWKEDGATPNFVATKQIPSAIVYDAIGDKFYAFSHIISGDGSTQFSSVNPETGELTKISDCRYVSAAACDGAGTIYAIDMNGNLGTVAPDGTWSDIGHTGYYPTRDSAINLGAAIDYRSGKMYWSLFGFGSERDRNYNENAIFALVEVDLSNARSQITYNYPINNQFSALTILNSHPAAPDNVFDLSLLPEKPLSKTGVITFTVPSVTYGQQPLTSKVNLRLALDGEEIVNEEVTPGAKYERKVNDLAIGMHNVTIQLETNGRKNSEAFASCYFGMDTPNAPENVNLTYDRLSNKVTLTWDAPTSGRNGGAVDAADLRYRIVRYPDQKTVARSAKSTTYTDTFDAPFGSYYYRVYPYYSSNPAMEGSSGRSGALSMGSPLELPYKETFDTPSSMNSFTLIDANGDGSDEWNSPCWKYDDAYYCAFYYGNRGVTADDWLVTPSLKMSKNKLYKLTYKYYAYYGYGSHLQVAIGKNPAVEDMKTIILDREFVSTQSDMPGITETIIFCPKNDETFIGFHHISDTMEHLSIDNIQVEEYADANVPGSVTGVTAVNSGVGQVTLTFTLPKETAGGQALTGNLTANIYKGDDLTEPAGTIENLQPGAQATWVDSYAAAGINIYTIVVSNNKGPGLSAQTRIDLTAGIPVQLKSVYARAVNSNQVEVSWNPEDVAKDANGDPLDPSTIRYLVYKPMFDVDGIYPMLVARDLDTNVWIDNDPFAGLTGELQTLSYYVSAVNAAAEGYAQISNGVFIGDAYKLPFAETWKEQISSTQPWYDMIRNGATFYPRAMGYDPLAEGHDGWGLMDFECDFELEKGSTGLATPRIDFTTLEEPVLKYWLYRGTMYDEDVKMSIGIADDKGMYYLSDSAVSAKADENGWEEITVSLANYADRTSASVVFIADVKPDQTIHLDEVSIIGNKADKEVRMVSFTTPADCRVDEEVTFKAVVDNVGSSTISNVEVKFIANKQTIATKTVASLAAGKQATVEFAWTPTKAGDYSTEVVVEAAGDIETKNNSLKGLYNVKSKIQPYVTKLYGQTLEEGVRVTWNVPDTAEENETVIDDVEAYDAFTIDEVGAWTLRDGDDRYTYNFSDGNGGVISWPNYQEKQAFIVFNPSKLNVPFPFSPHSGNQAFVSWAAAGGPNNDWLISPELPGNRQLISFVARSAIGGSEPFKVHYSTEGTEISDFHSLSGDVAHYAGDDWALYHYLIPEGTKHFAINYIGNRGSGLVIDDILFYGAPVAGCPDGYNIYRDNKRLNRELLTERSFVDTDAEELGTYRYRVAAVYAGVESRLSDEFVYENLGVGNSVANAVKVYDADEMIVIEGAQAMPVHVATAAGQTLLATDGEAVMEIPAPKGIYVVRVGRDAFKIIVK